LEVGLTKNCKNKLCTVENPQSLNSFYPKIGNKDGLDTWCKTCWKIRHQIYNKKQSTKDKTKIYNLKPENEKRRLNYILNKHYKISLNDYNNLLEKQNHSCGLCKKHKSEFKRRLAVDHDHVTGKVRGLLCDTCNRGLGMFKVDTNPNIVNIIKNYIESNT